MAIGRSDVILIVPKSHANTLDSKLAGKNIDLTELFKGIWRFAGGSQGNGHRWSSSYIGTPDTILATDFDRRCLYQNRGIPRSGKCAAKITDKYGEDPLLWQSLARIADQIGDREGAIEFANKAIKYSKNRYQLASIILAGIYFNDGQLAKARQLYSEAIQTSPNIGVENYLAYYYLGVVQFAQGDTEEALASFRKSAESRAGYTPAWKAIERVSQCQETGYSRQKAEAILSKLVLAH